MVGLKSPIQITQRKQRLKGGGGTDIGCLSSRERIKQKKFSFHFIVLNEKYKFDIGIFTYQQQLNVKK